MEGGSQVNMEFKMQPNNHNKIISDYPQKVIYGYFSKIRFIVGLLLICIYFVGCWLPYDGHQAILINTEARKLQLFSWIFWPQDLFLLSLALIISAFVLFAVTNIAGRIWCGYACPQSTFFWIFSYIKRKIITTNPNNKSNSNYKYWRQAILVHLCWLIISVLFATTFVGYFVPIKQLLASIYLTTIEFAPAFWIITITLVTYINAGILKEKICLNVCPYARLQSVMFADSTKVIAYDATRGEPRAKHIKTNVNAGDCVDCDLCVKVCPTGIDIRQGLQYECISCGACIDACNSVMTKLQRKINLIGYKSQNTEKPWYKTPRLIGFLLAISIAISILTIKLVSRDLLLVEILPERNVLYRVVANNSIENIYRLKLINKTSLTQKIAIEIINNNQASIKGKANFILDANGISQHVIRVIVHNPQVVGSTPLIFGVKSDNPQIQPMKVESRFFVPNIKD